MYPFCEKLKLDPYYAAGAFGAGRLANIYRFTVFPRDDAINAFNSKRMMNSRKASVMSSGVPIDKRFPRGFLFAFKRLLVDR